MSDRANVEEWFQKFHTFIEDEENDIDLDNIWNIDETGFQIGYLKNGIFLWTFGEIDHPVLTDAHETISVTVVESISAKGQVIPPFIIMPGIQIPSRWVDNRLDENATIVTTPKGYIDDVTAQDFFDHFEKYTSSDLSSESDEENVDQSPREVYQSHPEVEEIRMVSSTTLLINWNEVDTPELKMRQIRQYEQYVALRIECSVASGTPLTPSVSHVNEKLRKAHTTLAINSITAAQEMRRLKEKNLKRSARDQGTVILANYGPITVYDARLRVAKDLHNRRANQAAEELRFHKKEVRDEAAYARRWLLQGRKLLRASLRDLRVADISLTVIRHKYRNISQNTSRLA
ncbi:hypothetical protein FOFC_18682 [Fusarium oxysporum]|nr:hypothetical protein FOFC_18682 [Fusarium oxysporum]